MALDLVEEALQPGAEIPLRTSGGSMGATIRGGEWILVRRTAPEDVQCGDIVLFRVKTTFVAHRVIRRRLAYDGLHFITKGDAHLNADSPIKGGDIVATVVGIGRKGTQRRLDSPACRMETAILLFCSRTGWLLNQAVGPLGRCAAARLPRPVYDAIRRPARCLLLMPLGALSILGRTLAPPWRQGKTRTHAKLPPS